MNNHIHRAPYGMAALTSRQPVTGNFRTVVNYAPVKTDAEIIAELRAEIASLREALDAALTHNEPMG
jgi:hypothetical protein